MKRRIAAVALAMCFAGAVASAATVEPARITRYKNVPGASINSTAGLAGTVELDLEIDARGNLKSARVVKGRPDLVATAVRTVREWRFESAKVDGRNVNSRLNVVRGFDFQP